MHVPAQRYRHTRALRAPAMTKISGFMSLINGDLGPLALRRLRGVGNGRQNGILATPQPSAYLTRQNRRIAPRLFAHLETNDKKSAGPRLSRPGFI